MKANKLIFGFVTFFLVSISAASADSSSEKFLKFKYKKDDSYRILSTVTEDVKVNGVPNHHAEIVNRVTVKITDTDTSGRGFNEATFMTTENSTQNSTRSTLTFGENYESKFWRNERGIYDIEDKYFMPVVRDVPVFPEKAVKIGDTWTANGHEAHDLRKTFNIEKPFRVPFTATYKYERDEEGISSDDKHEKKVFQVISVKYSLFFESPIQGQPKGDFIYTTMGYSNQTIWWDNEKGQIDHYKEDFRILLETYLGNQFDFYGTAHAEVTEFSRTATEKNVREVEEKIKDMALENVSVVKGEMGLTISVENIQFKPDSAELLESEKEKIRKISKILESYPNDLLITGHTAKAGTEESCQILSEERADSVASYLIEMKVRDKYHIYTQGFGAKIPIASNAIEAGRAKNRRVEITILDK